MDSLVKNQYEGGPRSRESVRKFLKNNPEISDKIEDLITNPIEENEDSEVV